MLKHEACGVCSPVGIFDLRFKGCEKVLPMEAGTRSIAVEESGTSVLVQTK